MNYRTTVNQVLGKKKLKFINVEVSLWLIEVIKITSLGTYGSLSLDEKSVFG